MDTRNQEIEIDLLELIRVLWSRVWMIILTSIAGLAIAAAVTILLIKPVYTSTATMYVLTKSTSITSLADIQMGTQLTQDYMVVITSRPVVETVISNLGLNMSYGGLKSSITVNNPANTRFLEVTVRNNDAFLAKKIVDELANVSARSMAEVMDTQPPNIMDYGQIPNSPASPSLVKNSVIGAMLGFILACGIIIIMYLMNDSIKTSEDVEKYLGINTLGLIPLEEGVSKKKTRGKDATARKNRRHSAEKSSSTDKKAS